eukprot:405704_1
MTTSITPGYHESGTKWHLAPNFTEISLSEDDTIQSAIDLVLHAKNKHVLPSQKAILTRNVESFVHGTTIKYLNRLNDGQWDNLDCIPLICKVYLRHLLAQSFQYKSKQQLLEYDFNWGIQIDFNRPSIKQKTDTMLNLGFDYDLCCEAIIVTDDQSLNRAINYALLDEDAKQREYQDMKIKLNRMKIRALRDTDYAHYVDRFNTKTKRNIDGGLVEQWRTAITTNDERDIFKEIGKLQMLAAQLKAQRQELEEKLNENIMTKKLILYENYVKGILSGQTLNVEKITQWKKYRNIHSISDAEHLKILNELGYENEDALDQIKTYVRVDGGVAPTLADSTTTTSNRDNECVICFSSIVSLQDGNTAYMLTPCNHICLCQECALTYYPAPHHDQKCPLDCQQVHDGKKVHFS